MAHFQFQLMILTVVTNTGTSGTRPMQDLQYRNYTQNSYTGTSGTRPRIWRYL